MALLGPRDEGVSRAVGIGAISAIGTIDANAAFAFPYGPLDGVDDQAKDEVS